MRKKKEKILSYRKEGVAHGRVSTGTGRAPASAFFFCFGGLWVRHDRATTGTVAPLFLVNGFKIISFFRIIFGQIPTKQIKITQNKQNKNNKTRGLLPTKRSFKVISLTVRNTFK